MEPLKSILLSPNLSINTDGVGLILLESEVRKLQNFNFVRAVVFFIDYAGY